MGQSTLLGQEQIYDLGCECELAVQGYSKAHQVELRPNGFSKLATLDAVVFTAKSMMNTGKTESELS